MVYAGKNCTKCSTFWTKRTNKVISHKYKYTFKRLQKALWLPGMLWSHYYTRWLLCRHENHIELGLCSHFSAIYAMERSEAAPILVSLTAIFWDVMQCSYQPYVTSHWLIVKNSCTLYMQSAIFSTDLVIHTVYLLVELLHVWTV